MKISMEDNEQNKNIVSKTFFLLNSLLIFAVVFTAFSLYANFHTQEPLKITEVEVPTTSTAFANLDLKAKAVYVLDITKNEVAYSKNESTQLPLASLTKIMTALTAVDNLANNEEITIRKEFLVEEGDSGLLANESWQLKDLVDFSLITSSNDGARSIASVIGASVLQTEDYDLGRKEFILKMNKKAQELGLYQTYFINESGLDIENVSGGYGSAEDMAELMKHILVKKPRLLEATKYPTTTISSFDASHTAKNTNLDINQIPGILASKTGFTDLAGGNLVIAFDASIGRPIVIVVLGSTQDGRFEDITALVKASLAYIGE